MRFAYLSPLVASLCVFAQNPSKTNGQTGSNQGTPKPLSPMNQGEMLPDNSFPYGLTPPAKISLLKSNGDRKSNITLDASFIYWYASQDGMALAKSGQLDTSGYPYYNPSLDLTPNSVTLNQPFNYEPGFKVGLGYGFKDWELHAEYTWVRQNSTINQPAPIDAVSIEGAIPIWSALQWIGESIGPFGLLSPSTNISSNWKLGIDLIDATASRPFYQSRSLTISPYGGIRGAWIRQSLLFATTLPTEAFESYGTPELLPPQPVQTSTNTNSWAIGPILGGNSSLILGSNFRIQGEGNVSLLFTQYTKLRHAEDTTSGTPSISTGFAINSANYNCLRPTTSLGVGIGWGRYLSVNQYHIDFSLDYDFNMFWSQNMLTYAFQGFANTQPTAPAHLFLHGLTFSGRFDF